MAPKPTPSAGAKKPAGKKSSAKPRAKKPPEERRPPAVKTAGGAYVNEDLLPLLRPIAELQQDPRNARLHDARNLGTVRASLAEYGQQKPIVVLPGGLVYAGNGTMQAALDLGWKEIACVTFRGSPTQARGYSLADNRSGELARWNKDVLVEDLAGLREVGFDLEATGFTAGELDDMQAAMQAASAPPDQFRDVSEQQTDHKCPKCGYGWRGNCN